MTTSAGKAPAPNYPYAADSPMCFPAFLHYFSARGRNSDALYQLTEITITPGIRIPPNSTRFSATCTSFLNVHVAFVREFPFSSY